MNKNNEAKVARALEWPLLNSTFQKSYLQLQCPNFAWRLLKNLSIHRLCPPNMSGCLLFKYKQHSLQNKLIQHGCLLPSAFIVEMIRDAVVKRSSADYVNRKICLKVVRMLSRTPPETDNTALRASDVFSTRRRWQTSLELLRVLSQGLLPVGWVWAKSKGKGFERCPSQLSETSPYFFSFHTKRMRHLSCEPLLALTFRSLKGWAKMPSRGIHLILYPWHIHIIWILYFVLASILLCNWFSTEKIRLILFSSSVKWHWL